MPQNAPYKLSGFLRGGFRWEIICRPNVPQESIQTGTGVRSELLARMYRSEDREEIKGLINYLYFYPTQTHEFILRRQTSDNKWAVLHQSIINNTAKYKHPTETRIIYPQEISEGICNIWRRMLHDDEGKPHISTLYFLKPGELAWMFWAGAMVRAYYEYTRGGVVRNAR